MSDFYHQWLVRRASPPGMLACGLRRPDGTSICHALEDICPAGKMEKILAHFENLRSALFADQLAPRWSTWAFDQGQIRFVQRPDEWLLALVCRAESDAALKLDGLCEEFLALQL